MEYRDYYKILGVERNASEQEIKASFRKLARECHPDANPDDPKAEERFKELNEAYEVLCNAEKRSLYDSLGHDWESQMPSSFNWGGWATNTGGSGPRRNNTGSNHTSSRNSSNFSEFFTTIFGDTSGARRQTSNRGGTRFERRYTATTHTPQSSARPRSTATASPYDIEHELKISLVEAYHGTVRVLRNQDDQFEVKIPAGAMTGTQIRMRGKGRKNGTGAGDLHLTIKVLDDDNFERKGDDLYITITADLFAPVLGGEVRIPTLGGDVMLKVPAGSQNGQLFRLRGKGMPKLSDEGGRGDLYAQLSIELPTEISAQERALYEQLRQLRQ